MDELVKWLDANKISFKIIDNEVIEIEDFGKMFLADLSAVQSIFRGTKENLVFNLMENPDILKEEGINYVAFPFGRNWYYYDLREEFRFNILKYIGKRKTCATGVPFVNLGVHTPYELLNGSGDISLWVKKAKLMGHTAIGICDRNTMAATLNLQKECAKAGIKHVFGYSFDMEFKGEKIGMKIYCQTQKGLRNLLRIQKTIMVDSPSKTITLPDLLKYAEGNVLVGGTLSSYWLNKNPEALERMKREFHHVYYQVDPNEYKAERIDVKYLNALQHFFGKFYDPEAGMFGITPVLICDNYYLDKDDARNKIILNKIASGAAHEQSEEQYFKDTDEYYAVFEKLFDAKKWNVEALFKKMCAHTVEIAEGATASFEIGKMYMPRYKMTAYEQEKYENTHTMFLRLLEDGLKRLVPEEKQDEYRRRVQHEIYILESTDNIDYMLIQYDTVNWARKNGILVGCGRGSAGGCLCLYLLGITLIDPIKYNLLFERFLLPERAGLYEAQTTVIMENIESNDFIELLLENGKTIRFDRDSQLLVRRGEIEIVIYADEIRAEDNIIFDNRDVLFTILEL